MRTIEIDIVVTEDGTITTEQPVDLPPGKHHALMTLIDKVEAEKESDGFDFPLHNVGPWPENLSLRREDIYDDWGR